MSRSKLRRKVALGGGAVILALGLLVLSVAGCASGSSPVPAQGTLTTTTTSGSPVAQNSLLYTITVSGTGKVSTLPDEAVIQIGVESSAATAAAALDANSKQAQKVLARLKADGIPDSAIETTNVAVYPSRTHNQKTGKETITGYQATNLVRLTLTDFKVIGQVFAAATEAGANNISGPSWQLSENSQAMTGALAKAVANARSKAQALATAQGVTVGEVLILNEASVSPVYYYGGGGTSPTAAAASVSHPPVNPENLDVTASVTITYQLKH